MHPVQIEPLEQDPFDDDAPQGKVTDEDLVDLTDVVAEMDDVVLTCAPAIQVAMEEMLATQDDLNSKFVGQDWVMRAAKHEDIDYAPTILDEAAELMRSVSRWKFWKSNVKEDFANMRLEFIDMLHFTLSEAIVSHVGSTSLPVAMGFWYETVYTEGVVPTYNYLEMKKALFGFLSSAFAVHVPVLKEADDPALYDHFSDLLESTPALDWESFWKLAFYLGMTLEEVQLTYYAKVALNEFRIRKGDKVNTYRKIWWDSKEDNFFLMSMVEDRLAENRELGTQIPTPAELRKFLEVNYASLENGGQYMDFRATAKL